MTAAESAARFFSRVFEHRQRCRRQENRNHRAFQFRLAFRPFTDRRRALHVHVQQDVPARTQFVEQFRFQNAVAVAINRRMFR